MANVARLPTAAPRYRQKAMTLIELMIVVAIIGSLAAIASIGYREFVERARIARAVTEIKQIALMLQIYNLDYRTYPASLSALGVTIPPDPWGHPYQYLPIDFDPPPKKGKIRRDKNLNPLNSDYDLYSMGPDGQTQNQLTAAKARDDIVRANNGAFIGVAANH
jgi:general secretion pathway protein G